MELAASGVAARDTTMPWLEVSRRPERLFTALFALFPLWWLIGVSHFVFLGAAVVMGWELLRKRPVYTPMAFGLWLLFLAVVAAGGALLWVVAPGTVPVEGMSKLFTFSYRMLWYLAITIVALYILNTPERELPAQHVMRLLGLMFVYTTVGGLAGLMLPTADFPSLLEVILPLPNEGFLYSLVHPSIANTSDFLGYDQPRPSAPFAYPNAWGNNLGLFLPFLMASWLRRDAGWRRPVGVVVLLLSIIPITYSLNRGLWVGLASAAGILAVRFAIMGQVRLLQSIVAALAVMAAIFVASPLYDTVTLRVSTPHSNERRSTVAEEVVGKTVALSPLLGYGDTRLVEGSFASISGGETPDCHQCAAPPLGTQGFFWRLIFTTGLFGTALFLLFFITQLSLFLRQRDPVAIVGCLVIYMSLIFSFVYDSLESPLFTVMIAIGLMNRRFVGEREVVISGSRVGPV